MSNIKGYVLDNGRLKGPKQGLVASAGPDEMNEIQMYTILLKHPEGYVLFDSACHGDEKRMAPFMLDSVFINEEDRLLNRLAAIDVTPEDVNYVVLSHMHSDHTGYIECFPNAEICVSDSEFTGIVKEFALGVGVNDRDVGYWIPLKLKWKLIPDDVKTFELFDGITILNFGPGHSYGMLGMLVDFQKTGKVIIASDAIHSHENVGPPIDPPGSLVSDEGYHKTIEYIFELAKKENAAVWYGHDLDQFSGMVKSTEGFYE